MVWDLQRQDNVSLKNLTEGKGKLEEETLVPAKC